MNMVTVYTAKYCSFCEKAIVLLFRKGASFEVIDVTSKLKTRLYLEESTGSATLPQVFINGMHIGGCSDLYELDSKGRLDNLLDGDISADESKL
jgi:glutaredoxin 3